MALYAFDGTKDKLEPYDFLKRDQKGCGMDNTNVVYCMKLYQQVFGEDSVWYRSGPGTKLGLVGSFLGGVGGAGGKRRVNAALKEVEKRFREGDTVIDVVGFSRGAAIALDFAYRVTEMEFRDAEGNTVQPEVRFLGLFDTVGSFGIPGPYINWRWRLRLPENGRVQACAHALAIDERRRFFRPTRVPGATEVWFRGTHGDIGGGNCNASRYCIALLWMLEQANQKAGWGIDQSDLDEIQARSKENSPVNWDLGDPVKNKSRDVPPDDAFHTSLDRDDWHELDPELRKLPESAPGDTLRFVS